jgi:hypothetical protein
MALDTHHEPHGYWEQAGLALLWFAVLAGPAAVAANMLAGYALTKWACASGHTFVLTAIAAVMLIVALSGAWVGWNCRQRLLDANEHGGSIVDRSYFAALIGTGLSLLTGLLIVLQAFPHFVLSPCE